jgi:hypothetical protein
MIAESIQVDLIKLANGQRLLRVADLEAGLSLEKKLDPDQPVVRQKLRLLALFETVLAEARQASA